MNPTESKSTFSNHVQELRKRVADEIDTTFASSYTKEISLEEVLLEENINKYALQATGEKYLIKPQS